MIYFTSDQHFGHVNIIKYTGRPFEWSEAGAIECAVHIRDEYNRVVSDDDLVFHLGDYSLLKSADREKFIPLISSLKGHKVLILGNHDSESKTFYKSCGFLDVVKELKFSYFYLCHYPLTDEDRGDKNAEMYFRHFKVSNCSTIIHGHTHQRNPECSDNIRRFNVCVDYPENQFKPVSIQGIPEKEIESYFSKLLRNIKS